MKDYGIFLKENKLYEQILYVGPLADQPEAVCLGGYDTEPRYKQNLKRITGGETFNGL